MDEIVRNLVDGAYAAALDETLWEAWAWSAARLLGGVCGAFYVVEAPGIIRQRIILHESKQIVERYIDENIGRFDPQISHVARLPATRVYTDTDHVDWENCDAKEYFAWQASNGKMKHYVTAAACLRGGTHFAGLSVHRHVHDGPTPDIARQIMNRMLPDIYRSLELGFLHAEKMTSAYWEGLLTRRQEACLLLGDDGRVLRMTAEMEALLMLGDGLGCVQNQLACHEATADNRLRAFVSTLVRGETAPRTCRLDRPSGKSAYVMTGYPLPRRARILAPAEAAAFVVVVDPTVSPVSTTDRWHSAYGLTARETQFARMLTMGHSVETAAESLTISISTARVHLRNIFAKTGTNRQSELILLLSRLTV